MPEINDLIAPYAWSYWEWEHIDKAQRSFNILQHLDSEDAVRNFI